MNAWTCARQRGVTTHRHWLRFAEEKQARMHALQTHKTFQDGSEVWRLHEKFDQWKTCWSTRPNSSGRPPFSRNVLPFKGDACASEVKMTSSMMYEVLVRAGLLLRATPFGISLTAATSLQLTVPAVLISCPSFCTARRSESRCGIADALCLSVRVWRHIGVSRGTKDRCWNSPSEHRKHVDHSSDSEKVG